MRQKYVYLELKNIGAGVLYIHDAPKRFNTTLVTFVDDSALLVTWNTIEEGQNAVEKVAKLNREMVN